MQVLLYLHYPPRHSSVELDVSQALPSVSMRPCSLLQSAISRIGASLFTESSQLVFSSWQSTWHWWHSAIDLTLVCTIGILTYYLFCSAKVTTSQTNITNTYYFNFHKNTFCFMISIFPLKIVHAILIEVLFFTTIYCLYER